MPGSQKLMKTDGKVQLKTKRDEAWNIDNVFPLPPGWDVGRMDQQDNWEDLLLQPCNQTVPVDQAHSSALQTSHPTAAPVSAQD